MQDDCCQCYHSRRLGKSLHIPLSRCSAIPEYVNHLGFLTERFSSPPIHQCNASTFLAYLFTSYLSPSTQGFRKDEKPIQFLSILLKNFHIINITKKLKFLYIYKTFFAGCIGIEPMTSKLTVFCSTNRAHIPITVFMVRRKEPSG